MTVADIASQLYFATCALKTAEARVADLTRVSDRLADFPRKEPGILARETATKAAHSAIVSSTTHDSEAICFAAAREISNALDIGFDRAMQMARAELTNALDRAIQAHV